MSLNNIQIVENKFKKFGFETLDIQMDDRAVGISDGWVVYTNEYREEKEITWSEALYLESKKDIIQQSIDSIY